MSFMDVVKHPLTMKVGMAVLGAFGMVGLQHGVPAVGKATAPQVVTAPCPELKCSEVKVKVEHEKPDCPDVYLDNLKIK